MKENIYTREELRDNYKFPKSQEQITKDFWEEYDRILDYIFVNG